MTDTGMTVPERSARPAPAPFGECYVVPRTGLIAGEYPGSLDEHHARRKIGALLGAGVTTFIDLTEAGELRPYAALLDELAASSPSATAVSYRRFPIQDVDVPTVERMREILDAIDDVARGGGRAYVHCWGGVGRTGTVVGCHLVRHGVAPSAALDEVARLFDSMSDGKRSRHHSGSPETAAQRVFVLRWEERPQQRSVPPVERFEGALVGLAVGDALGTTLEFRRPGTFARIDDMIGGGPFGLAPGQWTDDTSMAMCLAESLLERGGFDAVDQMRRYVRWIDEGHWSSTGRCFDVGNVVREAVNMFRDTGEGFSGPTREHSAGNGSLMRLAPVPMFFADDAELAVAMAADSSRTTHGTAMAIDACRYFAGLLVGALHGESKATLLGPRYAPVPGLWGRGPLHPRVDAVAAGSFLRRQPPEIRGTGFVVESMEAALWAFATTESFEDGALAAVNLGDDADTTGAIFGQIAGAYYGVSAIPARWRERITRGDEITEIARRLVRGTRSADTDGGGATP